LNPSLLRVFSVNRVSVDGFVCIAVVGLRLPEND